MVKFLHQIVQIAGELKKRMIVPKVGSKEFPYTKKGKAAAKKAKARMNRKKK